MVALLKDMEMLLFPVYQDDRWTLFDVSVVEKMIRHYAPVGFNSTDVMDTAIACPRFNLRLKDGRSTSDPYHKETPVCSC